MELVLLTALGVGGATVIGALIGFIFKNISHKFSDIILSFAAGAMIFVVAEELIPEAHQKKGKSSHLATWGVMIGFTLMMILDVALG